MRRKLGVSTSIPVHLSQERNGKTVALDDGYDVCLPIRPMLTNGKFCR